MFISEIYQSKQGEGRLTGTPSVFVRTSGCNLRCGFCDTPFASWEPEGKTLAQDAIVQSVINASVCRAGDETGDYTHADSGAAEANQSDTNHADGDRNARHVVLTGGEPMLPAEIISLCDNLFQRGFHLTIETAGTIFRDLKCDLMSISPKLSNSTPDQLRAGQWRQKHESARHRPNVIRRLIQQYDYQLKFVVAAPADVAEIDRYLAAFPSVEPSRVMLMPEGITPESLDGKKSWLVQACQDRGYVFCNRKHIYWYGNRRGT